MIHRRNRRGLGVTLPTRMYDFLKLNSNQNYRSMSAEIEMRLMRSLKVESTETMLAVKPVFPDTSGRINFGLSLAFPLYEILKAHCAKNYRSMSSEIEMRLNWTLEKDKILGELEK